MSDSSDKAPEAEKHIYMKCRRTPPCDSIEAVEIQYAPGTRLYRCVKCNNHLVLPMGGKMDLRSL